MPSCFAFCLSPERGDFACAARRPINSLNFRRLGCVQIRFGQISPRRVTEFGGVMDERGAESIRPAHPLPRNSKRTDAENDMRCAHGSRPLLEEPTRPSVGFQVGFIRRLADSCSQSRKPSGRRIDLEGRWKRFHWVRLEPKDDPSPPLSDMKGRLPAVCIPRLQSKPRSPPRLGSSLV